MTAVHSSDTMSPAMSEAHRYHGWVLSPFRDHLKGVVLEVGSGHGRYAREIAPRVDRLVVSDIDPAAVDRLRRELSDLPNVEFRVMNGVDAAALGGRVDRILMINVLEHIEDDVAALRACRDGLAPGGRVLLFVPAFQALYSRMDEEAGHFRRYRRSTLRRALVAAGFRVETLRYFNAVGFFGWYANRVAGSGLAGAGTNAQIRAFDRAVPMIRHVDRLLPFAGQSVVAVATPEVDP